MFFLINSHLLSMLNFLAYTMAKYGMSMCVLGMSGELKPLSIAVNALWPRTGIHQIIYAFGILKYLW